MSVKPFDHQLRSLSHDQSISTVFDCSDPGTGKTFVRIRAFAARRKAGSGAALVIAPRSLLRSAWANDIKKFAPELSFVVADANNREEAFAENVDVYITNTDAVKWLAERGAVFFSRFSELVVDESTAFKHHTSQRSKALAKIAKYFDRRALLTGTPNGNTITDVWHQMLVLDGGARLGTSFYKFRDAVCTPKQVGRIAQAVKWEDKPGAAESVFNLLSDVVIRHKFEDCVSIPENFKYTAEYILSKKQQKIYDDLYQDSLLHIAQTKVTAINAAALATKLLQVASGAVYDGSGSYHVVDTGRYELVLDMVEQRQHSLVFFLWDHQKQELITEAEKRGLTFCVFDGTTSDKDRAEYVAAYQRGEYRVMFAHPASAGHGLTLTKGTATIWASPTYNLEWYAQGSKRQHRLGQTHKTETIVVVAKDTIDEKAYQMMADKNVNMQNLLDLFQTAVPASPASPAAPAKVKRTRTKKAETV